MANQGEGTRLFVSFVPSVPNLPNLAFFLREPRQQRYKRDSQKSYGITIFSYRVQRDSDKLKKHLPKQ